MGCATRRRFTEYINKSDCVLDEDWCYGGKKTPNQSSGWGWTVLLNRVVGGGLTEKLMCEQVLEVHER